MNFLTLFPSKTTLLPRLIRLSVNYTSLLLLLLGGLFNLCAEPFGLWLLGPFFLSPVFFLIETETSSWRVFLKSFLFFFGYFAVGLYWTSLSLTVDLKSFFWLIPFSSLGIPFLLSLLMAPSFWLFWKIPLSPSKSPYRKVYGFAICLVLLEVIRTYSMGSFPWLLFGYTLTSSAPFLQNASWIGIFGLSFLAVIFSALPYLLIKRISSTFTPYVLLALFILNWTGGFLILRSTPIRLSASPIIRLIQPNIPQGEKWNPASRLFIFKKLCTLSTMDNPTLLQPPQVIIWPEAALPFFLSESPKMIPEIIKIIPSKGLLITGLTRRIFQGEKPIKAWNSLLVMNEEGHINAIYDKVRLVPFGEYVPFRSLVHTIPFQKITHGTIDFSSGESKNSILTPPLTPFLPLICFEISFPGLKTTHYSPRPHWILTISNDAWFGTSIGPYQHLHMAQVRAVEERLPVLRGTNTGISAVIDPLGRIIASLPLNESGFMDVKCPLPTPPGFFAHFGNAVLPFFICVFIFFVGFVSFCISFLFRFIQPRWLKKYM